MTTFIRFMRGDTIDDAIAAAAADLARGYSFAGYASYASEAEALESDEVTYYGVDPETITQHEDGSWGFALAGLCGYTHERESISDYPYRWKALFYALFEGEYLGSADQGDGDVFRPTTLLNVAAI